MPEDVKLLRGRNEARNNVGNTSQYSEIIYITFL